MEKKYKLVEGEQTLGIIENGLKSMRIKLWPGGMSDERITDYIVYHLYRRRSSCFLFYASDLFSDNAIGKYYNQFLGPDRRPGMNYYIDQWLTEGDLSRQKITNMLATPKPSKLHGLIYMPSEELTKKRFLNTENGYMLCQSSTTGWAPRSECCQQCKYQNECRTDTKLKFPELVRLRLKDFNTK